MAQKLLLADDSVTIQRVIELTFAEENIDVVAVGDGDQAIARIGADPPDIVLADIGMPGRDGYEVSAFVKHTPKLAHIPVLLLTGAFEPVDQSRAAEVGSDGVLAKPFEPQLVISRVKELLSHQGQRPAALDTEFAAETPTARSEQLDDYFDRLDAAFANLTSQPRPTPAPVAPPAPEIDWFSSSTPASTPDTTELEMSFASPEPAVQPADEPWTDRDTGEPLSIQTFGATFAAPVAPPVPTHEPQAVGTAGPPDLAQAVPKDVAPELSAGSTPLPSVAPNTVPSLADAFAAILAAEQNDGPVTWPAPAASAPPAVGDELIEQVTHRVLERMTDHVVRETVSTIVSAVAERLVREEIERIKASLR